VVRRRATGVLKLVRIEKKWFVCSHATRDAWQFARTVAGREWGRVPSDGHRRSGQTDRLRRYAEGRGSLKPTASTGGEWLDGEPNSASVGACSAEVAGSRSALRLQLM
jgi:hypothetical protein